MYKKMTTLNLEELREKLREAGNVRRCGGCRGIVFNDSLPPGAIMNEIGIIFLQGNNEAEPDLVKLFENENPKIASVAYFFLSQRRSEVKPETSVLIEEYENNPANSELVASIKEKIAEHEKEMAQ